MTLPQALRLTEVLAGIAVALGALELLCVRDAFRERGAWPARTLAPALGALRPLLAWPAFLGVLLAQLGGGAALALGVRPWPAPLLLVLALLVHVRFRGRYNGGSDAMLVVLLLALAVAHLGGTPGAARLALLYVAVQLTLSYAVAGLVKLRRAEWWRGEALRAALASPVYGAPAALAARLAPVGRRRAASAVLIALECAMPLAWAGPAAALPLGALALGFHLLAAWTFGLNRFVWAWAAAWPALLWAAGGGGHGG